MTDLGELATHARALELLDVIEWRSLLKRCSAVVLEWIS
jgi:hypothetical protein